MTVGTHQPPVESAMRDQEGEVCEHDLIDDFLDNSDKFISHESGRVADLADRKGGLDDGCLDPIDAMLAASVAVNSVNSISSICAPVPAQAPIAASMMSPGDRRDSEIQCHKIGERTSPLLPTPVRRERSFKITRHITVLNPFIAADPLPICNRVQSAVELLEAATESSSLNSKRRRECDDSKPLLTPKRMRDFNSAHSSSTTDTGFEHDCEKSFMGNSRTGSPNRSILGDRPFACDVCGKRFAYSSHMTRHSRIHSGDKPYECKLCHKRFSENSNLKTHHRRIHSEEKLFICAVCGKGFSVNGDLTKHHRIHSGEKPYACPTCFKTFADRSNLTQHIRTHAGLKPFECSVCQKYYSRRSSLTRHMSKAHPDAIDIIDVELMEANAERAVQVMLDNAGIGSIDEAIGIVSGEA